MRVKYEATAFDTRHCYLEKEPPIIKGESEIYGAVNDDGDMRFVLLIKGKLRTISIDSCTPIK